MSEQETTARFISFGSGSSGNCYCFVLPEGVLLVDAGLPIRKIKHGLEANGLGLEHIRAILVTHEHSDHSRSLCRLAAGHDITIFGTSELFAAMDRKRPTIPPFQRVVIKSEQPFSVMGLSAIPFNIPHDSASNVGYLLRFGQCSLAVISDAGYVTPLMKQYAAMANYLILEADYDPGMLLYGSYSPELKARITGPEGHLSNTDSAVFLASLDPNNIKHVWLCHLSSNNNTHEKCREAFALHCDELFSGRDYLSILPRYEVTAPFELR